MPSPSRCSATSIPVRKPLRHAITGPDHRNHTLPTGRPRGIGNPLHEWLTGNPMKNLGVSESMRVPWPAAMIETVKGAAMGWGGYRARETRLILRKAPLGSGVIGSTRHFGCLRRGSSPLSQAS